MEPYLWARQDSWVEGERNLIHAIYIRGQTLLVFWLFPTASPRTCFPNLAVVRGPHDLVLATGQRKPLLGRGGYMIWYFFFY